MTTVDALDFDSVYEDYLTHLAYLAKRVMLANPWVGSIGLLVAQYWDDQADDETHTRLVLSRFTSPDFDSFYKYYRAWNYDDSKATTDRNIDPSHKGKHPLELRWTFQVEGKEEDVASIITMSQALDNYYLSVSLLSHLCEGGSQDNDFEDNYRPAIVFHSDMTVELLGDPPRPELFGIEPGYVEDKFDTSFLAKEVANMTNNFPHLLDLSNFPEVTFVHGEEYVSL